MNNSIELYLTVIFYLSLVGLFLKLVILATSKYPRKEEHNIGYDISLIIVQLGFFIWVIYLRWFSI